MTYPIDPAHATVGALLQLGRERAERILVLVGDNDLDDPRLRMILSIIRDMVSGGLGPDPVLVYQQAQARGLVHRADLSRLADLLVYLYSVEACPLPSNGEQYAAALIEAAVRRQVGESAQAICSAVETEGIDGVLKAIDAAICDMREAASRVCALDHVRGAA